MKYFILIFALLFAGIYGFFQTETGKKIEAEGRARQLEESHRLWEAEHGTLQRAEFTNLTQGYFSGQWFGFKGDQAYEITMEGSRISRMKAVTPKK